MAKRFKFRVGQRVVGSYKNKQGSYQAKVVSRDRELRGRREVHIYNLDNGHWQYGRELKPAKKRRRRQ